MLDNLKDLKIILGSQSPRRQYLLKGIIADFDVLSSDADESFSSLLEKEKIALYLADKKSLALQKKCSENSLLITCDTIVWLENKALNKPLNRSEAVQMLELLSGKSHQVFTGVTLWSKNKTTSFFDSTVVHFNKICSAEIDFYIDNYKPFDKAGSYGVQEWLGYIAIHRIEGCFFNVMGLPLPKLYNALKNW